MISVKERIRTIGILRPNLLEISEDAFINNLNVVKQLAPDCKIIAVLKANAYGHNFKYLANISQQQKINFIGVASIEEGIILRNSGINLPILILGSIYPFENLDYLVIYNLTPTVSSIDALKPLSKLSEKFNKKIKFHLKVDTGMHRIGISPLTGEKFLHELSEYPLQMQGIYTHFADSPNDYDYTMYQLELFKNFVKIVENKKINVSLFHTANSAAIIKYPQTHFNCIRPGIMLYGVNPVNKNLTLKPVLRWKTKIVFIKKLQKNKTIGYLRTFTTKRDSIIATIACGYADGYPRLLSNCGEVLVKGKRAKIVGVITMDMMMIDVTDIPQVKVGDDVILIGKDGDDEIKVEEIAMLAKTIPYEIFCRIGERIPRVLV